MITTVKTYLYKTFGLIVESDIYLPELETFTNRSYRVDINIKKKNLSEIWSKVNSSNQVFVVNGKNIMFEVPDVAIFSIEEGNTIHVSTAFKNVDDKIRLYLLGSCMGIILLQRNTLPLHGSSVVIEGKAYAFIGDSGAGKSTLASTFIKEGYQLLSDDIVAITYLKGNVACVLPSYPQQKLWEESLKKLGMEINDFTPLFDRETKFSIPVHSNFYNHPIPLGGIFEISKSERNNIDLRKVQKLNRFLVLKVHTFRKSLIEQMNLEEWHFQESAKCINTVPIYQLTRPSSTFTAHDLVNTILNKVKGEK